MYKNGNVSVTKATALSSLYVSDKVLEIGRYDLSTTRTIETKIRPTAHLQPRSYGRGSTTQLQRGKKHIHELNNKIK